MLARFFESNHGSDSNELANEALSRVAKKLRVEHIRNISAFAYAVSRLVLLEDLRKNQGKVPIDDSGIDLPGIEDPEAQIVDDLDNKVRLSCLRTCLAKLPENDRRLVIAYHEAAKGKEKITLRKKLATSNGRSAMTLRKYVHDLRGRLRECMTKQLNERR